MKDEIKIAKLDGLSENFTSSAQRVLTIDLAKYEKYLRDSGMDDEQKEEYLRAVWSVMMTFVELGFGVHPLQEVCGKDDDKANRRPKAAFDRVESDQSSQSETSKRTGPEGRLEVE